MTTPHTTRGSLSLVPPLCLLTGILLASGFPAAADEQPSESPFPYVWGQAHHILPETHNNESGYFSLCEGLNGRLYVGTAKYGENSYLVEFDPATGKQRIVVDTHKLCGVKATGFAAQAKIHTPNFVGPSGTIYFGSKQGYRMGDDKQPFPGGYVMTYHPETGKAECLGMPYPGNGVGDVVADEKRGLLYIVSERVEPDDPMRWMLYDKQQQEYRELGPHPTPYATTLIDAQGRANILTSNFQLAQYDPATGDITRRQILIDGQPFTRANDNAIPTWQLADDGRTAYLILMNDPTLLAIDLASPGKTVRAVSYGKMIEGDNPDSRCALDIAPDGRIYAVVRVDNKTGFGSGYLHHLLRFDPKTRKTEDLGVLAVKNPDFFDFGPRPDGTKPPWSHGYHRLPDGTLTPLHHHMALIVAHDGTINITILSPFTLLKIAPIP